MTTNATKSWAATRLPFLTQWQAHVATPALAREAPYLGILPTLITAALLFMAVSGAVLAVHYDPAQGFASLQFIDRNVPNGWLIHAFHETGTTMIFGAVYLLMFRAMLTRAYQAPGDFLWLLTVAQFSLLLLVGYLGYGLSDGAVSYWSLHQDTQAAQSLTGLPGALGTWFFAGPQGPDTLARLAVFHTVLALAVLALMLLHFAGRQALTPTPSRQPVSFHPYYTAQYFVAFVVFALIFSIFVFFAPHFGENRLNLAAANPLVVPLVTTPPWYLAPLAALACGVWGHILLVVAQLGVLFALPWLDRAAPGQPAGFWTRFFVFVLALDVIALGLAARAGPSALSSLLVVLFTAWYFLHFLVLTPLLTAREAA